MRDILFFDNMLTPKVIVGIYWRLLVSVILGGLGVIFGPRSYGFLKGRATIILGSLGVRVWCEQMIVAFKMNEALQDIRHKSTQPS